MKSYGWPTNFPAVASSVAVTAVMKHHDFIAAKTTGDVSAADRLVGDLADRAAMREVGRRRSSSRLIVVGAPDAANQIPLAFARLFSRESGLALDMGVLKANSPKHTGKSALYRFTHRASFDGTISTGANYVVLDDVMTQGGTISELRQFLQRQGSRVVEVATLAYTTSTVMSDGKRLAPTVKTLEELEAKHGRGEVSRLLTECGIYAGNLSALTESECRLLIKTKDLDEIRTIVVEQRAAAMPQIPLPAPRSTVGRRMIA